MSRNRWKEKYISFDGHNMEGSHFSYNHFISSTASVNGVGSRENPRMSTKYWNESINSNRAIVIGSGAHKVDFEFTYGGGVASVNFTGNGMFTTIISGNVIVKIESSYKDITFLGNTVLNTGTVIGFRKCMFYISPNSNVYNSIAYADNFSCIGNNNSFIRSSLLGYSLRPNLSTFEGNKIQLFQSDINDYQYNYYAFQSCRFKIGNETTFIALTGANSEALRANFVTRCEAQGITLPQFTEYDFVNKKMGRWIFTNNSIKEGRIVTGSEVDLFQKTRGFYLGYSDKTVESLPIAPADNIPNSFAPSSPRSNINVAADSISLLPTFKVTERDAAYITGKPMWLGGKNKLTELIVANNLPQQYGVNIDSTPNTANAVTVISPDVNYIVRSSDGAFASVSYNGTVYTTSLITRNNIFRGMAGTTAFTTVSGSPVIIPVEDLAGQQTLKIRVVSALPAGNITSGNLQTGYWYFVEPNSPSDLTGTVTYNGIAHPVYDSFLVSGDLTFTIEGNCHLRRMWRNDYSQATEVTDKAFWADKQKPYWIDVVPDDMRCLMKNNTHAEVEMQTDADGNYIASGHPDFYSRISGEGGFVLPSFAITGAFMQVNIDITSLNPM